MIACPLTLCTSELILHMEHQQQLKQEAHDRWYQSLSPAERARQDQREAAAMMGLGLALSGGGPTFAVPPPAPYRQPGNVNCVARSLGNTTYLDCP